MESLKEKFGKFEMSKEEVKSIKGGTGASGDDADVMQLAMTAPQTQVTDVLKSSTTEVNKIL